MPAAAQNAPPRPVPAMTQGAAPRPDPRAFLDALRGELETLQRDLVTVQDSVADLLDAAGAPSAAPASGAPVAQAVTGLQALDKATQVAGCLAAVLADWESAWPDAPAASVLRARVTLRDVADRLAGTPTPGADAATRDTDPTGTETPWF